MKNRMSAVCLGVMISLACSVPALAQDEGNTPSNEELYRIIQQQQRQIEALRRQLEARDEAAQREPAPTAQPDRGTEELREIVEAQQEQIEALAQAEDEPSALDKLHIGGYGELHYNNLDAEDSSTIIEEEIDLHRFVLFFGYDFTDDIRFNSELEIEHALAGESAPGEVELEQAYVEFDLFRDTAAARAGLFLIPVGILNETHEPPTFYGVERNDVENIIIPTTWWAGGAGYTHKFLDGFQWDFAVHEGLMMPTTGGSAFRVRSGRQKTAEANAEDLAATTRLKYTGIPGVELGGSVQYQRDATQANNDGLEGGLLYEAHVDLQRGPFGLRALYAAWDFDIDRDLLTTMGAPADTLAQADRAEDQHGWYVEPSYKLNPQWGVYARYEDIEAARVQDNFNQWEAGFNYWPHPDVVLKFDYRSRDHDLLAAERFDFDGFDLGVGYQF